tara:strand:+ start:3956 stop:4876 length:921 start_codon:yes stop_codon:yes gene_type:complete
MKFAIIAPETQTKKWKVEFEKQAPEEELLIGYETDTPDEIECVLVWGHPKGSLEKFKNLKLIFSMGAGVDHILNDETIPKHIPISRIVDPQMAFSMTNYILMAILNYQRCWYDFQHAQSISRWAQFEYDEKNLNVGILGIGHLGLDAANALYRLGFQVYGYSNSMKETIFPSFYGNQLKEFLEKINVLVCTVPLTPKTRGMLSYDLFCKLIQPTYLVNVSRGAVHIEKDIIKAIEEGKLTGAFLDVFEKEPLPKDSPLWKHPKIKITPHVASLTYAEESIRQALENYQRIKNGKKLINEVSRYKMY